MSVWKDIENKGAQIVSKEKQGLAAWVASRKGWLTTTVIAHILGWVFGKLL